MTLTDALGLLAFLLINLACGVTTLFLYASVEAILAGRHSEIWRPMDGYTLAARQARAQFFCSLAPFRLNDPDLARAVIRAWVATGVWFALGIAFLATMSARA